MALIGEIRKRNWILLVAIGFALAAFIFMDSTQSSNRGGAGVNSIGKIAGEEVDYRQFSNMEQTLYNNSQSDVYVRRNALWNWFVEDALIKSEMSALGGLEVTRDELMELQYGGNLSPIIQSRFRNQQTGQIDVQRLQQIKGQIESNTLDENLRNFWFYQEKEIRKDRVQNKLNGMISKGIYAPNWMVEMNNDQQSRSMDFEYVRVPFADVDDSEVAISDSDLNSYLKANPGKYRVNEETRNIDYMVFDVLPSSADSSALRQGLSGIVSAFAEATDDSLFVENNFGRLDVAYFPKSDIEVAFGERTERLFTEPVGSVIGPFIQNGSYTLAKVVDRKVIPDSVKSRHILLPATTQTDFIAAQTRLDSIKTAIEAGTTNFTDMANKYGTDGTKSLGGDLGFTQLNGMVKPFNDLIFFTGKKGDLNLVATQYGLHLVEITDYKFIDNEEKVRLAIITENIQPSEETQNADYEKIVKIVSTNRTIEALTSAAASEKLNIQNASGVKENDFTIAALGTGQTSRDIVKWAFDSNSDVGAVSNEVYSYEDPNFYYTSKYVVAGLGSIQPAGKPSLASVRSEIESIVRNSKKGEILINKISSSDLNAVASQFGTEVDNASGINFNSTNTTGLGNEPKVIAMAFSTAVNQVSKPVVGESGVYLVRPTVKPDPIAATNIPQLRQSQALSARTQVSSRWLQDLKASTKYEDMRSTFF